MFFTLFLSAFNGYGSSRCATLPSKAFVHTGNHGIQSYRFVLPMSFSEVWELYGKYTIHVGSSHGSAL